MEIYSNDEMALTKYVVMIDGAVRNYVKIFDEIINDDLNFS